jgi:predicted AlkP superfamily phosphohydrolase/phosphomutase
MDGTGGAAERGTVREFFQSVDEGIGELVEFFGPEAYIFVVSDHGFGSLGGAFGVNEWLAAHGYIRLRRGRLNAQIAYARIARAARKALESMGLLDVARAALRKLRLVPDAGVERRNYVRHRMSRLLDWSRTSALLRSSSSQGIYLNTDGRSPKPTVRTAQDRRQLLDRLKVDLLAIEDPETGDPLVTFLREREEIYDGPYVDEAPDLILELRGHAVAPVSYAGEKGWFAAKAISSGVRRSNGVFLVAGPGVRPEVVPDLSILDVAPTVLHAAGIPVPRYMEGDVRIDLFEKGVSVSGPVEYSDLELDLSAAGCEPEYSEAGEGGGEVEQRLRDLGHLWWR